MEDLKNKILEYFIYKYKKEVFRYKKKVAYNTALVF